MQNKIKIKIKKLDPSSKIPKYAKPGDAGIDLTATSRVYDKYGNVSYGTGLAFEIPEGYMGLLFPRSSVSKQELSLANSIGVIDSGYRGEVILKFKPTLGIYSTVEGNDEGVDTKSVSYDTDVIEAPEIFDNQFEHYKVGDRIGQLVILPYPKIELDEVKELSESVRGEGKFGSTGS